MRMGSVLSAGETGELDDIGWVFFPFHGGPRKCLGDEFALMEVYYTIIRLLQAFSTMGLPLVEKIEPPGTERQMLTLVLLAADRFRVTMKRESCSCGH